MDPRHHIESVAHGYQMAAILLGALRAGLFEGLAHAPRTAAELAEDCRLDARATETVLLALAAHGFLARDGDRFALAPGYGDFLTRVGSHSMVSILRHNANLLPRWLRLEETLRTGRPVDLPRPTEDGESGLRDFICGMADISRASSHAVINALGLARGERSYRRMLDLGGGPATAAIAFAQALPELEAVVFDLPAVVEIAREQIADAGLENRITTRAGDLHTDGLGERFDLVYISNIIHMLAPGETGGLFGKVRAALEPGGTVIVKDFLLDDDRMTPVFGAVFSVNMLLGTPGGKSYTLSETRDLLRAAGFGDFETLEVATHSRLLVARAV